MMIFINHILFLKINSRSESKKMCFNDKVNPSKVQLDGNILQSPIINLVRSIELDY